MAGTWSTLLHQPGVNVDTMLLLTDGTVMAHELSTASWHRLTPDSTGSYASGVWSALPAMPNNPLIPAASGGPAYMPLFFGSAVLRDGTVLVAGGEYNGGVQADMAAATRFDPVANAWTNLTTPAGWAHVGDVPLCVMPDGRVLLGSIDDAHTAFLDPATNAYTVGPDKADRCAEESFTLLPDGTVLAVQCSAIPGAEKYNPATNTWVAAGATPATLPQACAGIVPEIGPTVVLTNGHAFVIGATGNTAIYTPPAAPANPGTWTAGPTIVDAATKVMHPIDAPAVLLPNGRVLLTASPAPPCSFPGPTTFFEYAPATNTLAIVGSPANAATPCFQGRFLLLPSGDVLYSSQSGTIAIYTPDGAPDPAWRPHITAIPSTMAPGHSYPLSGLQLNGLSQACCYGDDATMATNYPVVRVTSNATGAVTYCRTGNHSTMAIATGAAVVSTTVTIPGTLPTGSYTLVVVANGIPSEGVGVNIQSKTPLKELKDSKVETKEHKLEYKEIKEAKIEHKEIKEAKVEHKELKDIIEHKPFKENIKAEVDVYTKAQFENKQKDAEGGLDFGQFGGDPAIQGMLQHLSTRIDELAATVRAQRAPIGPEERPVVGEAPLLHSSNNLAGNEAAPRNTKKHT